MSVYVVVHGYGEITLPHLVKTTKCNGNLKDVPGITFMHNGELINTGPPKFVDRLDNLPLPSYDLIDMECYAEDDSYGGFALDYYLKRNDLDAPNKRGILVCVTRGCIAKCTFCIHEKEFPGFRYHSDEYAVKHLKYLYDKYDIRIFSLGEEMVLTKNMKFLKNFFKKVEEEGMNNAFFRRGARADTITDEALEYLKKRNVFKVGFGFESGDQRILDSLFKHVTVNQNISAIKLLKKHGYADQNSYMVGTPGEN